MGKKEENPNPIYIPADLVEDVLFRLPLKSILKFKAVSKQWRSILESRRFAERRMSVQKNRKILAVRARRMSRFYSGDDEIEVVYLKGDDATRPSLTCDGLICIPVPGCVKVLNPSTGELLRFPFDAPSHSHYDEYYFQKSIWWNVYPAYWDIGFGKDEVNGSYKVVRMPTTTFDDPNHDCEILDVNIGKWRKLNPPPYKIEACAKSAFANGSIYWIIFYKRCYRILALDLHTEEFRELVPPRLHTPIPQLVNFQDRLAITQLRAISGSWHLEIWSMDAQEERWSMTYSISLYHRNWSSGLGFRPMAVSKEGNLFLYDSEKRLFKYCPETDLLLCLARDICVLSPFVENLVPLRPKIATSGYQCGLSYLDQVSGSWISSIIATSGNQCGSSWISSIVRRKEWLSPNILLTSSVSSNIWL